MVNTVWVNANNGRDLHPLTDHMTKLQNFSEQKHLFISISILTSVNERALTNLIVCLMKDKNYIQKLHKRVSMLQWILGRFGFLQNLFEMRLPKNLID